MSAQNLVLASASSARALVLERAGLTFKRAPAHVDETAIKQKCRDQGDNVQTTAMALAQAKAQAINPQYPGAWIIGADQMLVCDGRWFDKPVDMAEARSHLRALRGKTHELISAICVVRDDHVVWQDVSRAQLTMISFSDDFLENYLDRSGPEVLESVGVYRLEGLGPQLFSKIDGDYFTILGLPLLPLLAFLREADVVNM